MHRRLQTGGCLIGTKVTFPLFCRKKIPTYRSKKKSYEPSWKLAVITSALSGIGYKLAMRFAQAGYDLFVVAEDDGITQCRLKTYGGSQAMRAWRNAMRKTKPSSVNEVKEKEKA